MPPFRTLRPVVLPHLAVLPPALAWRLAAGRGLPDSLAWLPTVLFAVTALTIIAAWRRSRFALGTPLVGFAWLRDRLPAISDILPRCYDYFTLLQPVPPRDEKRSQAGQVLLGVVAGVPVLIVALQLLMAAQAVYRSPWLSALAILSADLLVLAVAIRRAGCDEPATTGSAAPAPDPAAKALESVRAFYESHRDLVEADYPQARLDAELSVRIPPGTGAVDAWKEARELIRDLQKLIQAARTRRSRPTLNPPPGSRPPDLSNI